MKPIDEMTPEEIRLEIAERKNWVFPHEEEYMHYVTHDMALDCGEPGMEGMPMPEIVFVEGDGEPPNWPADIAAAWELEGEVPEDEHEIYARILNGIVNRWYDSALERGENVEHQRYYLIHAAPLQRCKAWLAWKRGLE